MDYADNVKPPNHAMSSPMPMTEGTTSMKKRPEGRLVLNLKQVAED
jgi:hypothetical protein